MPYVRQRMASGRVGDAMRDAGIGVQQLLVYGMLACLLLGVFLLGIKGVGGNALRFIFILGSVGITWRAYKIGGLPLHVEVMIALFVFAPFLRRVVDMSAGYNASAVMLLGPLLGLVIPYGELKGILTNRHHKLGIFVPYFIMIACILYGWALSTTANNVGPAIVMLGKLTIPLLYGMCLIQRSDQSDEIINSAARAFLVISPIAGLYGVYQYQYLPEWDRLWMLDTKMLSAGLPERGLVRVFSTMNAPASFAAFAGCGLLLFGFCRRGWFSMLMVLPISIGLLLSLVRGAWISVAIGVVYCFFFNATRGRAILLTACLAIGGTGAVLLTPFGETIGNRLATLGGDPANDGSGHARLKEYVYVYSSTDQYLLGAGIASEKDPHLGALDGQFLTSAVTLGLFIGNIHLVSLIWAGVQALMQIRRNDRAQSIVAGAVVIGNMAVLPLTAVAGGEIAFLFWMFVGVLTGRASGLATAPSTPRANSLPQATHR